MPESIPESITESVTTLPLRDIHLPDAVSWWPLPLGWWLLLVLLIVSGVLVVWWRRRQAAARVRAAALLEWQQLLEHFQQQRDELRLVQGLSILLRRVLLSYYPRAEVASLSGNAWLQYLDKVYPARQDGPFSSGVGRTLIDAPYQQQVGCDVLALHALCGEWLAALPPLKRGQS